LAHEGNYPAAMRELTKAVNIDPADLQAHYYLALVYSSLHDFVKAAEQYEVILKKLSLEDPKNAELFSYLGQLYFTQGREDKAVEQFEKVLKIDPKNTGAMLTVALYYLDHDRRKEAVQLLERCTAQDPMDDSCLNSLSYIYAEDNVNIDEALRLVQSALKIDPENAAYLDTLGWVYYRKGLYQESLKELGRAEALLVDPEIYSHIAEVYLKLDQPDMAKKYWNLSLQADPNQPGIKSKLGIIDQGQPLHSRKQD
jgi:Tfp pilus assembly protein PilF